MPTIIELQKAAAQKTAEARRLAEAAESAGGFTKDTKDAFDAVFRAAQEATEKYKAAKADEDVIAQAKALADTVGMPTDPGSGPADGSPVGPAERSTKNLGLQVVESAAYKSLMARFSAERDQSGMPRIPEKARVESDPIVVSGLGIHSRRAAGKALFTGNSDTSAGAFVTADRTDIVELLGRRPLTLRDIISVRRTRSDLVEYVRQTSHTNAAAPVPEATSSAAPTAPGTAGALVLDPGGGYKPEGSWAFEIVSTAVRTIAEWVPATKRALADVAQLEGLIRDELEADLAETEETQMVTGSGTGENLRGILSTSGIQTQAFDTDIFRSVRKGLTKARTVGRVTPNAVLMHPTDVETVDLARENGTTGAYLGAGPFAMGPRTLWGYPIVESEAMTAGFALVGDFRKAVLWDREQTTVTMTDSHADFFIRNLVAVLAEERVAFGVTRPAGFVNVDVVA